MPNRVHRRNRPLFDLPPTHPAAHALITHASCREKCVGHEIAWPGKESEAFDQEWYSEIDNRKLWFSSFAYQFISYDLVLDGWIERCRKLTDSESRILENAPRLRALMDECERAAKIDENHQVLQRVPIVREWIDALEKAVLHRVDVDEISISNR